MTAPCALLVHPLAVVTVPIFRQSLIVNAPLSAAALPVAPTIPPKNRSPLAAVDVIVPVFKQCLTLTFTLLAFALPRIPATLCPFELIVQLDQQFSIVTVPLFVVEVPDVSAHPRIAPRPWPLPPVPTNIASA